METLGTITTVEDEPGAIDGLRADIAANGEYLRQLCESTGQLCDATVQLPDLIEQNKKTVHGVFVRQMAVITLLSFVVVMLSLHVFFGLL